MPAASSISSADASRAGPPSPRAACAATPPHSHHARRGGPDRPAVRHGWRRRGRRVGRWTRPPARRTATPAPGSRARPRSTSRRECVRWSSMPTSEGISSSGPLVTMTDRTPCGKSEALGLLQRPPEGGAGAATRRQEGEKRELLAVGHRHRSGVARRGDAGDVGHRCADQRLSADNGTGGGQSCSETAGSPTPTPSSCKERRMSAWLRRSPATSTPRTNTTNVTTTTSAITPPPPLKSSSSIYPWTRATINFEVTTLGGVASDRRILSRRS